jgi:predicted component of type VI protein secretion system
MPSLRISFPEKESPSVVILRGKHITVGRLPQNTIQIRDRTISARHAELIEEGDHYRLHDLEATNGILVNGEPVTDFHLQEACKVTFGGVECEFSPETPAEAEVDPSHALMTSGDCERLISKNSELEQTITTLREQIADLQKPVGEGETASDLERLTGQVNSLKETIAARDRDIQQLKTDLALFRRDRENLQRALKEATAKPQPAPAAEAPKQPEPAARPAAVPIPAPTPTPMQGFPAAKPAMPPAKTILPKPRTPLPHAVPVPAVAVTGNGDSGSQPRPIAKSPAGATNPQVTPKPSPATRLPTATGPKGTQKIP